MHLMYFSGRQLYSHNRLQRSVHLQDLLWSRKVCIKVYTKNGLKLANGLKLQIEKKMETSLTSQYQNQSPVDFHLCQIGRLFLLIHCFCLFFDFFNKQSDPRLFAFYSVFSTNNLQYMPFYYCKAIFEFQSSLLNTHFVYIIIQYIYKYR